MSTDARLKVKLRKFNKQIEPVMCAWHCARSEEHRAEGDMVTVVHALRIKTSRCRRNQG